jgi:hypothetical protein
MVRQVTAKDRFARAVAAVNDWRRRHRHWPILRGHFAYYTALAVTSASCIGICWRRAPRGSGQRRAVRCRAAP